MANKIPWYITTDWKSITGVIFVIVIIAIVVIIIFSPNWAREIKARNYKGESTARITNIIENKAMSQSHDGNKIYVRSYTVSYYFDLNGTIYTGKNDIKATLITGQKLYNAFSVDSIGVPVKYDLSDPKRSLIVLD
ncbi:MAG: hypothetical protein R2804_10515 [Cyclobacteriaceae bacterium]